LSPLSGVRCPNDHRPPPNRPAPPPANTKRPLTQPAREREGARREEAPAGRRRPGAPPTRATAAGGAPPTSSVEPRRRPAWSPAAVQHGAQPNRTPSRTRPPTRRGQRSRPTPADASTPPHDGSPAPGARDALNPCRAARAPWAARASGVAADPWGACSRRRRRSRRRPVVRAEGCERPVVRAKVASAPSSAPRSPAPWSSAPGSRLQGPTRQRHDSASTGVIRGAPQAPKGSARGRVGKRLPQGGGVPARPRPERPAGAVTRHRPDLSRQSALRPIVGPKTLPSGPVSP
jgi:hypothetical protein